MDKHSRSHLFLVRLWCDEDDGDSEDDAQWHGRVQHVVSGKANSFGDWDMLVDFFQEVISDGRDVQRRPEHDGHNPDEPVLMISKRRTAAQD